MTLNPAGYVEAYDFGIPQAFTARANDVVSGGEFVYAISGTSQAVGSVMSTFVFGDIEVLGGASGTNFPVGVAAHNVGSLGAVKVVCRGVVIAAAGGAVVAGEKVVTTNGANSIEAYPSGTNTSSAAVQRVAGRALTTAASGGFVLVNLNA